MTETNRYACLRFPTRQHARPWTDVSTEEMKAFIGLLILMGVLHLPRIQMYWQIDDDLMRTPGISSIMSRIRFQQIFRFLHLAAIAHDYSYDIEILKKFLMPGQTIFHNLTLKMVNVEWQ